MENKKRTDLEECVIHYKGNYYLKTDVGYKKIILTDNQDLIKDGVQSIDDTFLEWFVRNPSCESVEVINEQYTQNYHKDIWYNRYKIIIPQEEPKQDLEKEMFELEQELDIPSSMRWHNSKPKQEIKLEDIFNDEKKQGVKDLIDAHKQETLEEAAERYARFNFDSSFLDIDDHFIAGAEWRQGRLYSEEDLKEAFRQGQDNMDYSEMFGWDSKLTEQQWFEQFKKK
jgi:hypothetical protein